jgi:hypothetical protein
VSSAVSSDRPASGLVVTTMSNGYAATTSVR